MSRRARLLAAAGLIALLALAGGVDRVGGRGGLPNPDALPAIARTLAAAVALFSLSGYALARVILPPRLRADLWLFVLPVGAVASALALTLLGFVAVPFPANLVAVLLAGAGSAAYARRRLGPEPAASAPDARRALRWAALVAGVIVAVAVTPLLRADSFATVTGNNGDAHLATGAAVLLQHTYPSGMDTALPIDRMPGAWRSKYPIYYSLAAVSSLAGLDPPEGFVAFGALLVVLTGIGFHLLARHMLGATIEAGIVAWRWWDWPSRHCTSRSSRSTTSCGARWPCRSPCWPRGSTSPSPAGGRWRSWLRSWSWARWPTRCSLPSRWRS